METDCKRLNPQVNKAQQRLLALGLGKRGRPQAALLSSAENDDLLKTRQERDAAVGMLAAWCVSVELNGTGWDDWDEHYKDAMYRPGPLREPLDAAITQEKVNRGC